MKQFRSFIAVLTMLVAVLGYGGQAAAETITSTQELRVTAIVPGHRDIVVNAKGDIIEITSNTPEDIMPKVYLGSVAPQNERRLTDGLYREYRQHVPLGTAQYGTLYEANLTALLSLKPTLFRS